MMDSDGPKASLAYIVNPARPAFILCVWNRKYKAWGLPGGKVEPHETSLGGLVRELREETNLFATSAEFIYKAPTVTSDSGRIVSVFDVIPDYYPAAPYTVEAGSPIDWLTRNELCNGSKFSGFYVGFFATLDDWSAGLV